MDVTGRQRRWPDTMLAMVSDGFMPRGFFGSPARTVGQAGGGHINPNPYRYFEVPYWLFSGFIFVSEVPRFRGRVMLCSSRRGDVRP